MKSKIFSGFRLVGGTSLSLQLGHRLSVDIDLFSDAAYGTIDFVAIDNFIEKTFLYHNHISSIDPALGKSYIVGKNLQASIKLDIYYTDAFIFPALITDNIRLATIEEILAMKIDVVQRKGRKKDFWDLHELLNKYNIEEMLNLHQQRYPFGHDETTILKNFTDFTFADEDFDPICLRGKYWDFIKEDIIEAVEKYISDKP